MALKIQPLIEMALGGIGSALSTSIEAKTARENTDRTNQANRELAEYQYSKDVEMWNRGNAYNNPTAQMARLKAAGLNPNLVYGSGAAAGNTTQQLPKYSAPTMNYSYKPPVDPLSMIGAFQNFKIQNAQYDNLKAQNENIQADTAVKLMNEFTGKWRYKGWAEGIGYENALKREALDRARRENRVGGSLEQYQEDLFRTVLHQKTLDAQLKAKEVDFWEWGNWSKLLQGFGVKLPSFRK